MTAASKALSGVTGAAGKRGAFLGALATPSGLVVSMRSAFAGEPSASPMRMKNPHGEVATHTLTSRRLAPARAYTIAALRSALGERYASSRSTCSPFQYTLLAPPEPIQSESGRARPAYTNVSASPQAFSRGRMTEPNDTKPRREISGYARQLTGRSRPG